MGFFSVAEGRDSVTLSGVVGAQAEGMCGERISLTGVSAGTLGMVGCTTERTSSWNLDILMQCGVLLASVWECVGRIA